jgi:hypothetical protein
MTYISEILLVIVNIAMAYYHSTIFKKGKKVKHGWWGAAYLGLAGLLSFLSNSWVLFILCFPIRKVVFDLSLNAFIGRQLFFVSTETDSILDKLHYKLFGKKSEIYMAIYALLILVGNVLIFNHILR